MGYNFSIYNGLKKIWKEAVWNKWKCTPGDYPEGLRKYTGKYVRIAGLRTQIETGNFRISGRIPTHSKAELGIITVGLIST
jgi:hypothetical protein